MTISAPFRFARINRKVWFPKWAPLVSHDVPFADGLCGTIDIEIETKTPLLIGGKHEGNAPGTVHPFIDGKGNWAIPGTSIQGMVRQILEVAAFGKLGPAVSDRRFGVRDISRGKTAEIMYRGRLVNHVQTGWLVRDGASVKIIACHMERIEIAELISRFPRASQILQSRNDAKARLEAIVGTRGQGQNLARLDMMLNGRPATLVLTGKTNAGIEAHRNNPKRREFLFYGKSRAEILTSGKDVQGHVIDSAVWRDFRQIHEPEKGSGGDINPNWAFWKDEFQAGRPVPVFYIEEGGVVSALGMAQMFKLAMQLSTHEMLNNSSADHLDRHKFDLPSLIFGATGDKNAKDSWFAHNLKRRAAFDLFRVTNPPQNRAVAECRDDWQVLLSPKPSYYPIYVRQNARPNGTRPYAAYHRMPPPNANPELSGTKIWPVRGKAQPQPDDPAKRNEIRNVANHLRSVPEKQTFSGSLRVHNLRPVELGALLWALTYGEEGAYTHRLGGAKPLGFGEIGISVGTVSLTPNRAGDSPPDKQALIDSFVAAMNEFYGGNWQDSVQIKALRKAAQAGAEPLGYLDGHKGYRQARDDGQIMDGFADNGHEFQLTKQQNQGSAQGAGGNKPAQSTRRNWPKEEDAPVRHKDGREGFIRETMHAACKISVDGMLEIWSEADFVVTGPPDE